MSPSSSSAAVAAPKGGDAPAAASPALSTAERESRQATWLVFGALGLGGALQIFIAPGPWALVLGSVLAGAFLFGLSQVMPGKWRDTLVSFRFIAVLLFALSLAAVGGTLILQNKPMAWYEQRYGLVGSLIVALRLDDIFHSLWFAGFVALFFASVANSAIVRWPVRLKNVGYWTCHAGLLTSLLGAGASAVFSVRGRVDLHAGGEVARQVMVTKNGLPTGEAAALGFDLKLDRFDLVRYTPEYRVAYYDLTGSQARLKASFDPEVGVKHLLPGGDSFKIKKLFPEFTTRPVAAGPGETPRLEYASLSDQMKNPAAVLEVTVDGDPRETGLMLAARHDHVRTRQGALVFERREDEVKAFQSHVTAGTGTDTRKALVSVNDPFTYNGWTFYQVNYDPKDPSYSGLEAVRDPGVNWVFLGFGLICLGVFYMFYLEDRFKKRKAPVAVKA
ncbi:MAG: cytochrome c biogenesis protein ResB [Deltaproteobacteria bacterium]|nr:cytochrome c biogenesis protein ResB [Deltaproteobacteria bacterium]